MFQSAAEDDSSRASSMPSPTAGFRVADAGVIPVFVGDRHPITISALKDAVRQHPRLTFAAATDDAAELVRLAGTLRNAVCILDPSLFADVPGLYRKLVGTRTSVVLWADSDAAQLPRWDPTLQAIVLSKRSACAMVLETLVHSRTVGRGARAATSAIDFPALTARESEIFAAVRSGLQNKEIAAELGISVGTVKVHLHSIYRKLGIERRSQIAQLADHDPVSIRLAMLESRARR